MELRAPYEVRVMGRADLDQRGARLGRFDRVRAEARRERGVCELDGRVHHVADEHALRSRVLGVEHAVAGRVAIGRL
ncbi:MAG TPA: hypothetical protein PKW35_24780, partial [Nannocystaceae bacterium]|nr:hypothetical protein [Nannocystaceae bacterium]